MTTDARCPVQAGRLEQQVMQVLRARSRVHLDGRTLTLSAGSAALRLVQTGR